MIISSLTPEGQPYRCPLCGKHAELEPCYPGGDSVCPSCGHLFWLLQSHVAKTGAATAKRITFETRLLDGLDIDSLDTSELLMAIEEELGIEIPNEATAQFKTVGELIEYVRRYQI